MDTEHRQKIIKLVAQVQAMVEESGSPQGFDSEAWVSEWIERPIPALGGRPIDFLGTKEGFELVSRLLAQAQSGAFA